MILAAIYIDIKTSLSIKGIRRRFYQVGHIVYQQIKGSFVCPQRFYFFCCNTSIAAVICIHYFFLFYGRLAAGMNLLSIALLTIEIALIAWHKNILKSEY